MILRWGQGYLLFPFCSVRTDLQMNEESQFPKVPSHFLVSKMGRMSTVVSHQCEAVRGPCGSGWMASVGDGLHIVSAVAVGEEADLGLGPCRLHDMGGGGGGWVSTLSQNTLYFVGSSSFSSPSSTALAPGFPAEQTPEQPNIPHPTVREALAAH